MTPREVIVNAWKQTLDELGFEPSREYQAATEEIDNQVAGAIEAALVKAATEGDSRDHGGPKFLVLRIQDGKLESIDCPAFVLLAKDMHAQAALVQYGAELRQCGLFDGTGHSDKAIQSLKEHIAEFRDWPDKKEPD